ncbi:hypothetical protein AB0A73_18195 [Glycomyces sp. NPDC047369]
MATIPTLGSFDPPTTTADEGALEDAARAMDAQSGRIIGRGTETASRMATTAVEFSELVSEPIRTRGGEFLSAATAAMEGAVWGSAVTVKWAGSVREYKEAVKALLAEWESAVGDAFGIRESQVGGGTPNLTPAEREAATEEATAYAGQLKLAEMNAAANAAYEKFKGDAADAGGMLKGGPTPKNLHAMAADGGVDSWSLFNVFGMDAPMPLTGDWGGVLGKDLLDAIARGNIDDLPAEVRGQLGVLQALVERAHHLQSTGGTLSAGELAYLEQFFGAVDKSVFDMPDLLGDTNWSDADKSLILAGMGGGLLALSDETLGGGTKRLPSSVAAFVDTYVGKGRGADLKPQHHDGDELRALAAMLGAVDDRGMALMTGGKEFSGALTIAVAEHLDGEAGGFSIGEDTARTILDHSTANFAANTALLNGDLQHPFYKEHTGEAVLRGLFGHQWSDGGAGGVGIIDWIPRLATSDDPELRNLATEAAYHLMTTMSDDQADGPWKDSAFQFFTDSYGKIGDFAKAPLGVANPLIAQSMGRTAIAYIDYLDAPNIDRDSQLTLSDDPRADDMFLDKGTRARFVELVMGDKTAGNALGEAAYAKVIGEAGGMGGWDGWQDARKEALEDGGLIGLLDTAYRNVYEDATGDAADEASLDKQHATWVRSASTVLKEIVTELPAVKPIKGVGQMLIKEALELGKWGPNQVESSAIWQFSDNGAPAQGDRAGDPEYEKFGFEVTHSVVSNLLDDPKSGVGIDDVRAIDSRLVEKGSDGQYRLRPADELLTVNEPPTSDEHRGNLDFREANAALQHLLPDRVGKLYESYVDAFVDQRKDQ